MLLLSMVCLAVLLALTPGVVRAANVEGTITAINHTGGTLTVKSRVGHPVTLKVTAATAIERNLQETTFSALKVGDFADVDYNAHSLTATGIDATGR